MHYIGIFLVFWLFFFLGYVAFSFGTLQIILILTCTIPMTRSLCSSRRIVDPNPIYKKSGITIIFWLIITAIIFFLVIRLANSYMKTGFFAGYGLSFLFSIKHWGPNDKNLSDYLRINGQYININSQTSSEKAETNQPEREAIKFGPPMQQKSPAKVLKAILFIIAIFVIGLYFYVHSFTKYFDPTGETYRVQSSDITAYLSFTDNKIMQIYVTNKTGDTIARYDYRYSGYQWNHFLGNLYFSERSILSLRTVEDGAIPATVMFGFISGRSASIWDGEFTVNDLSDVLASGTRYVLYFYPEYLLFDDTVYEKVDEVDEALKFVTDTIIDEYEKGSIG